MKVGNLTINPVEAAKLSKDDFKALFAGLMDSDWETLYNELQKKYGEKPKPKPKRKQNKPKDSDNEGGE
jgi:hypothetical protein